MTLRVRELRIISVILDLRLKPRKQEMVQEILAGLYERKMYALILLRLERIENGTQKIIVKTTAQEVEKQDETLECPICFESCSFEKIFTTNCNHTFCTSCTTQHLKKDTHNKCPMCRTKITSLELKLFNPSSDVLGEREYSL